jgi:hypothetical protein
MFVDSSEGFVPHCRYRPRCPGLTLVSVAIEREIDRRSRSGCADMRSSRCKPAFVSVSASERCLSIRPPMSHVDVRRSFRAATMPATQLCESRK